MPAVSKAQRALFAIAEHHPSQLHAENRSLLKLAHSKLHDFAATSEKGLPERKGSLQRLAKARKRAK